MKHGRTGYTYHHCRCDVCKSANREYMRGYRSSVTKAAGARLRAVERLISRYPDEFQRLLEDEVASEVAA